MKIIRKEYVKGLEWGFKLAYLLLGLATFHSVLYDSSVQPFLVKASLVLGGLALLGRLVYFRNYIKTPYWIVLVLFCVSFLLSMTVNRQYGAFGADFKWLVWTGFLFFLLYVCDRERSVRDYKKEFHVFAHILVLYTGIAAVQSLYQMQTLYHVKWFTLGDELMMAGFHWGRLWGVYTDPNYGGVLSVLAVLLCIYYCIVRKSWRKLPYGIIAAVNYFYILFCDSRTAELALTAAAVLWVVLTGVCRKWKWKRFTVSILLVLAAAGIFVGGGSYLKTDYSAQIQAKINAVDLQNMQLAQQNQTANKQTKKKAQTARTAELQADVSNGRLALWESGWEIWKTSPVLGTGYNSFLPYVRQNLPETYVVNNTQGAYVSLHNEYINIMVYQGLLGIGTFAAFGILVIRRWKKSLPGVKEADIPYIAVLSSCAAAVGVAMVFLMEGLYTNSPAAFVLWSFLGYLMHYGTSCED